jgi:hypothetical protein
MHIDVKKYIIFLLLQKPAFPTFLHNDLEMSNIFLVQLKLADII